ncbi:MAG: hypothetical protein ACPGLV_10970, partial [Bacteroidia bacterium]
LGLGYQPFKFRTTDQTSKSIFNETTFMMPYFALELKLKRSLSKTAFFSISANLHVNTLATYQAEYGATNSIEVFDKLEIERDLAEYAGVQHGVSFAIGKQITEGPWSGIDYFLTATLLNRQKLVMAYTATKDNNIESGKIRYNGGFIGLGICYNFNG